MIRRAGSKAGVVLFVVSACRTAPSGEAGGTGDDKPMPRPAPGEHLPPRSGERPRTTNRAPHQQLTQNAPREWQDELHDRIAELPGVMTGPSRMSLKGSRGFFLDGREFAHIHIPRDGSMHVLVAPSVTEVVERAGWGERHPSHPSATLLFGPRNEQEVDTLMKIVRLALAQSRAEAGHK